MRITIIRRTLAAGTLALAFGGLAGAPAFAATPTRVPVATAQTKIAAAKKATKKITKKITKKTTKNAAAATTLAK